ncbi:MAG: V-type ATP synthase subunit F [Bryobacteraceae bacterium]
MPGQRIVVIGDEDAVFGLGLIGLEGRAVASVEQARVAIRKALSDPDTALVLLTENWSAARPDTMEQSGALVVEIPGPGPAEPSLALEARIEQALGVRLEH